MFVLTGGLDLLLLLLPFSCRHRLRSALTAWLSLWRCPSRTQQTTLTLSRWGAGVDQLVEDCVLRSN
jgi:hypothetical protein